MIFRIFRTEYKPYLLVVSLCLAACTAAAAALGIAGLYGSDARAAELAGSAFTVFNAACNFMPLLLFILAAVGTGTKCLRTAGVKERDILLGRMFGLFAWTAIFVLAEMLLVTAFDFACFAGRDAVRVQVWNGAFMLSLRARGAGRLLLAPSAAVGACLMLLCLFCLKAALKPEKTWMKVFFFAVAAVFMTAYQLTAFGLADRLGIYLDASYLPAPGSVLPNNAFIFSLLSGSLDDVKDAMLFSEPLLNPVWLVCELAFCVLACGFIVLMGRYDNEIEG